VKGHRSSQGPRTAAPAVSRSRPARGEYGGSASSPAAGPTASDGVGEAKADVRITLGASEQIDLTLAKGGAAGGPAMSKEEAAKIDTMQKAFDEGIKLTQAGKLDEAIAKFMEAKAINPDCFACQFNIGLSYAAKKDVPKAEEAFLAASALKPESPEPFNQMANLYNASKQYDKAAQMAAEASKRSAGAAGAGGAARREPVQPGVVL
jgi:tetratricopeptide (TPR) repeat protein